jgi:hypothetical protein
MAFAAPVFTKLTNVQQHYVLIFCTEFYPNWTKGVENMGIILMEAQLLKGIIWRSCILTVIQICQEMWKLQVGILYALRKVLLLIS